MDLKTKLQTPAGADNNFYLLKSASKIKIIKIQPIFSHRQLLWQALCLSVSNTKGWDNSSKIPSAIYSPRQEVWFSGVVNYTWKSDFFFDGPLHYFIKCYGKTCELFLITVDTQTHAGADRNFNLLKSASKTKICNRNPVGFFLCKLPWKSDLFLMAPCVILLRDMEKTKD